LIRKFRTIAVAALLISGTSAHAADNIQTSGDILATLLPVSAFGATYAIDDEEGREQFYRSFFTTVIVTHALKYSVRRERPDGSDRLSFPSGHTSSAFQAASFLHMRYGWKVGLPAYLLSSYVGWTRVHAKKHYWSDVAAGASIGIASNLYFTEPDQGVSVNPFAAKEGYGVNLTMRW